MTTEANDSAAIAKWVTDHNLRALLLRLADDDVYSGTRIVTYEMAENLGLIDSLDGRDVLTALGHEVAALLRPARWTVEFDGVVFGPDLFAHFRASSDGLARRIVGLLNADDLAEAKRYEVGK